MSLRIAISVAVVVTLGVGCVSTDAFAYRGGVYRGGAAVRGGVYRGGVAWRGGAYRGAYVGRGVGVGLGAAAVGAAVAAPYYYGRSQCGYYPYPACY